MKGLTTDERQVLSWLQTHKAEIVAAESKWHVDRRAIAGAIAWEALENVMSFSLRASGPGKVHYSTEKTWGEGDPVSKQVESAGMLPKQTMTARKALLATVTGAVDYIGAIMRAAADIAATSGYNISCDPVILTNLYQGKDLPAMKASFAKKKAPTPLAGGNPMDIWVASHLAYLQEGVGKPAPGVCTIPPPAKSAGP
jgi:hypothetical protein